MKDYLIIDREGILNVQKEFYQKLYKKGNTIDIEDSSLDWVNQYTRKIPEDLKEKLEEEIELEVLKESLSSMKHNTLPWPDGCSYEFLKIFWEELNI